MDVDIAAGDIDGALDVAMDRRAAAEDVEAPVVDPNAVDTPPVDTTRLPPEKRSSEESVQPQSETLFY